MSISGISSRSGLAVQSLVAMRSQLDDLQRQLGTGKKSDTYAGIGLERGLTVGLRGQISALTAYDSAITTVGVRLNVAQSSLDRINTLGHDVKASAIQSTDIDSTGSTIAHATALNGLGEILGLLNTKVGDRYIFSGKATDQPAVETLDHIMNGDGARAGLLQVIDERNQADLGTGPLGRLVISAPTATSVSVGEDVAGSPFGFKLASINTTLSGATVTGPAGVPPAVSIDLGPVNPNPGEKVQFRFTLPDGSSENITLTATASATPATGEFSIGIASSNTAANLQAALTTAIGKLANTSLKAASTVAAAADFFADPPQRVAGPPPLSGATALVAGTPSDTVIWYTGENGPDPARSTATAQVDPSISVSYGMRANEEGLRWVIQNMAALAAVTFSPTDPNATGFSNALGQRIATNLDVPPGVQTVAEISTELAGAQTTIASATERHRQSKVAVSNMLQSIEGAPNEEVAAQILALQTRLQASLQTTSMLLQTSLVNYL
jgi:flagellin-like hook-associated protein FlgL